MEDTHMVNKDSKQIFKIIQSCWKKWRSDWLKHENFQNASRHNL